MDFDYCLRVFTTFVSGLYRYTVLFVGIQFSYRFNNTSFWINFEFLQTIVGNVVNAVRYFGVFTLVIIGGLDL